MAQLVEQWSPKPKVAGSSPVSPAIEKYYERCSFICKRELQ